jgi:hypothetical protein
MWELSKSTISSLSGKWTTPSSYKPLNNKHYFKKTTRYDGGNPSPGLEQD